MACGVNSVLHEVKPAEEVWISVKSLRTWNVDLQSMTADEHRDLQGTHTDVVHETYQSSMKCCENHQICKADRHSSKVHLGLKSLVNLFVAYACSEPIVGCTCETTGC